MMNLIVDHANCETLFQCENANGMELGRAIRAKNDEILKSSRDSN